MGNDTDTSTDIRTDDDLDALLFRAFLDEDLTRGERRLIAAILGFDAEDVIIDLEPDGSVIDLTTECAEAIRVGAY